MVELAPSSEDNSSAFAVAKLIYAMLGLKPLAEVSSGRFAWPEKPQGGGIFQKRNSGKTELTVPAKA